MKGVNAGDKSSSSKKVICITTGEVFLTIKEASEKTGVSHGNISSCCGGNRHTAGKHPITGERLVWMYLDKVISNA